MSQASCWFRFSNAIYLWHLRIKQFSRYERQIHWRFFSFSCLSMHETAFLARSFFFLNFRAALRTMDVYKRIELYSISTSCSIEYFRLLWNMFVFRVIFIFGTFCFSFSASAFVSCGGNEHFLFVAIIHVLGQYFFEKMLFYLFLSLSLYIRLSQQM